MHVEATTLPALSIALDAAAARHEAIASNIAHANRAGHVPLRPRFDVEMNRASPGESTTRPAPRPSPFRLIVHDAPLPAGGSQSAGIHLDQEMAALSQNALHYQALLKGVNRYMALMASAVTEGKR